MINRRTFLIRSAFFASGLILPVGVNSWISYNQAGNLNNQRLVVIFLRGGIDGLNVLIPYGDDNYYDSRPTIAVNPPNSDNGALDLDGYFGLHPALKDLMPLWKSKTLAFINCCGLVENNRSHFEAQYLMETASRSGKKFDEGWMNRLLSVLYQQNPTQGINLGSNTPQILKGKSPVANIPRGDVNKKTSMVDSLEVNSLFSQLYQGSDPVKLAFQQGNKARQIFLQELQQEMMTADNGAPDSEMFVFEAKKIATLMKGNANSQIAFMDFGKWDTHVRQTVALNRQLPFFGKGLATLVSELGDRTKDTTIVVISEFGRTVGENGNGGTDHGHGNVMWVLGGKVKGGKIYGKWDGLETKALHQGRDLPVNTDFRIPIATIFRQNLGLSDTEISKIFPDFSSSHQIDFL